MNKELIEKLWGEAQVVNSSQTGTYLDETMFAELIVAECAKHITACYTRQELPYANCHHAGLMIAAREIKQHFGLKK